MTEGRAEAAGRDSCRPSTGSEQPSLNPGFSVQLFDDVIQHTLRQKVYVLLATRAEARGELLLGIQCVYRDCDTG